MELLKLTSTGADRSKPTFKLNVRKGLVFSLELTNYSDYRQAQNNFKVLSFKFGARLFRLLNNILDYENGDFFVVWYSRC